MIDNWECKKLKDCFKLRSGDGLTSKEMINGDYPVFGGNSQAGTHNEYNLSGDNVIIGRVGALCGNAKHIKENIWLTDNAFKVTDKKYHFDNSFLTYLLNHNNLRTLARQAAQPVISNSSLAELELRFPLDITEQKRIVAILDQVFADIEQARAKTEQNLKNARELFESYLQQVFSQSGEGWIEAKLSDVCEGKITDGTHQTPKYFDEGYIFLSSRNVTSGEIDWNNIKYIDEAQHVAMQKRLSPRVNDILLAKNGTTGVAAIVDKDVVFDIYVSLALLRPSNKIVPRYLLHFVNSSVAKSQFNKRLKGAGVPNLHLEEIREVVISYPVSLKKQQQILKKIDLLLEQRNVLVGIYTRKLAAIDELKKSILQQAFTGQLTNKKGKGVAA